MLRTGKEALGKCFYTPKKLSFRNIAGELFARTQSSILLKYNDRTGQKDYINVKGRVAFSVTKIVVIFNK